MLSHSAEMDLEYSISPEIFSWAGYDNNFQRATYRLILTNNDILDELTKIYSWEITNEGADKLKMKI